MQGFITFFKHNLSVFYKLFSNLWTAICILLFEFKNNCKKFKEFLPILRQRMSNLYETNMELGLYHYYTGNFREARFRFWLMNAFCKNDFKVRCELGKSYYMINNIKKAQYYFESVIKLDATNIVANYYLNKILHDGNNIDVVPVILLQEKLHYNKFQYLVSVLEEKNINIPEKISYMIVEYFGKSAIGVDVLEIGCRCGINGYCLKERDISRFIIGVDVNNDLLNEAKQISSNNEIVYDEIICSKDISYLNIPVNIKYDVILLIEQFSYNKNIAYILNICKNRLNNNGIIIVVEGLSEDDNIQDYKLMLKEDRFVYKKEYLLQNFSEAGCIVKKIESENLHNDKPGALFLMY